MAYVPIQYPSWAYNPTQPAQIVASVTALQSLQAVDPAWQLTAMPSSVPVVGVTGPTMPNPVASPVVSAVTDNGAIAPASATVEAPEVNTDQQFPPISTS